MTISNQPKTIECKRSLERDPGQEARPEHRRRRWCRLRGWPSRSDGAYCRVVTQQTRFVLDTNVVSALRIRGRKPQVETWAGSWRWTRRSLWRQDAWAPLPTPYDDHPPAPV